MAKALEVGMSLGTVGEISPKDVLLDMLVESGEKYTRAKAKVLTLTNLHVCALLDAVEKNEMPAKNMPRAVAILSRPLDDMVPVSPKDHLGRLRYCNLLEDGVSDVSLLTARRSDVSLGEVIQRSSVLVLNGRIQRSALESELSGANTGYGWGSGRREQTLGVEDCIMRGY